MVGHQQEAAVEGSRLAHEHRVDGGLHVVVDAPRGHAAEEPEGPLMGVEHHLLGLARVNPDIDRPRRAQPNVGRLHPHRLAGDLDVLMAPVELERLTRRKRQRHERHRPVARRRLGDFTPARRIAPHRVIGAVVAFPDQQVPDPRQPQPVPLGQPLVLSQQRLEPFAHRADLRKRLRRALIAKRPLRRPDRLAHHLARQPKVPRNRLDRLARRVLTANPHHCLHHQHPDLDRPAENQAVGPKPSE